MRTRLHSVIGAVLLGILSLGLVSCQEEPVVPDPEFYLARDAVSSRKGSQFLDVITTGSWTITSDADWIQVIPDKGRGTNRAVALCYDANTGEGPRSAEIRLDTEGKTLVVTLSQRAPSDDPEPEINGGSSTRKGWMELPETRDDDALNFFWHTMTVGNYTGRNYSFYWDYSKLVAHWVAYPLNNGLRSSGSRTDLWGYDPLLPATRQPNVGSTFRGGWARGHQLPSADRLSYNANVQTFYGTNMTPQDYNFNGEIWARLEDKVRSWAGKSDTLYVVTGCVVDGDISYTTDIDGKRIGIPTAYYKAVLSYSKSASENGGYRACGVYLEHTTPPSQTVARNHPSVMSIRALEQKLGFNLFVNLPAAVGETTAAAVETEDPNSVSWWWN
jgi:endonuclease G